MNSIFRTISVALVFLLCTILGPFSSAQEEAPAEETTNRLGNFFFSYETWVAQPVGLGYHPATVNDTETFFSSQALNIEHGTNDTARYELEYQLPSNSGSFSLSLFDHEDSEDLSRFDPANFIFGQTMSFPLYAGVNNDGLADAFISSSGTTLRDWSLEFSRDAFHTRLVSGQWSIGWRRVEHSRQLATDYFALVPGFGALLPPGPACLIDLPDNPACRLDPLPDSASFFSKFEGRGATIGLDLEFPLWKNKLVLEGGIGISVMRGKTDTSYLAENHVYILEFEGEAFILGPPYDEFEIVLDGGGEPIALIDFISQFRVPISMQSSGVSTTAEVFDAELGVRWRTPLKRLEVYAGMRQTHYDNVGLDLRPQGTTETFTEDGFVIINVQEIKETPRSVTYEGFYGGVRIRLY